MPEASIFLMLLIIVLPVFLFILVLIHWIISLKIDLQGNENTVKEGYISYEGRNLFMTFLLKNNYGKAFLTNKRLVLKYIRFLEHEIEIPLENIRNTNTVTLGLVSMIKVDFIEEGELKSIYFYPRGSLFNPFGNAEEWKNEINNSLSSRSSFKNLI